MWMKAKSGTYHLADGEYEGLGMAAVCQSYNLDRFNALDKASSVSTPPEGAKVCKKCSKHV